MQPCGIFGRLPAAAQSFELLYRVISSGILSTTVAMVHVRNGLTSSTMFAQLLDIVERCTNINARCFFAGERCIATSS
jgi:hypothetical protein